MSEDLIKQVQRLIDSGRGDSTRLHEIFNIIKQGSPLYLSDYKYLESLSADVEKFKQESESDEKKESKNKSQKKSERMKKADKIQSKEDTALKILKNRLASGEITIEEFNVLKKIIKET